MISFESLINSIQPEVLESELMYAQVFREFQMELPNWLCNGRVMVGVYSNPHNIFTGIPGWINDAENYYTSNNEINLFKNWIRDNHGIANIRNGFVQLQEEPDDAKGDDEVINAMGLTDILVNDESDCLAFGMFEYGDNLTFDSPEVGAGELMSVMNPGRETWIKLEGTGLPLVDRYVYLYIIPEGIHAVSGVYSQRPLNTAPGCFTVNTGTLRCYFSFDVYEITASGYLTVKMARQWDTIMQNIQSSQSQPIGSVSIDIPGDQPTGVTGKKAIKASECQARQRFENATKRHFTSEQQQEMQENGINHVADMKSNTNDILKFCATHGHLLHQDTIAKINIYALSQAQMPSPSTAPPPLLLQNCTMLIREDCVIGVGGWWDKFRNIGARIIRSATTARALLDTLITGYNKVAPLLQPNEPAETHYQLQQQRKKKQIMRAPIAGPQKRKLLRAFQLQADDFTDLAPGYFNLLNSLGMTVDEADGGKRIDNEYPNEKPNEGTKSNMGPFGPIPLSWRLNATTKWCYFQNPRLDEKHVFLYKAAGPGPNVPPGARQYFGINMRAWRQKDFQIFYEDPDSHAWYGIPFTSYTLEYTAEDTIYGFEIQQAFWDTIPNEAIIAIRGYMKSGYGTPYGQPADVALPPFDGVNTERVIRASSLYTRAELLANFEACGFSLDNLPPGTTLEDIPDA